MHASKIAHRDIKSHNVLLDDNDKVKLCDFGLAKHYVPFWPFNCQADLNKGTR